MTPYRVRQICRARNRFTPSLALWQHFVVPHQPLLRQQRLSSTASVDGASPQQDDQNGVALLVEQPKDKIAGTDKPPKPAAGLRIKKYDPQWPSSPTSEARVKRLLKTSQPHRERNERQQKALEMAKENEDYEAVVVKPELDVVLMSDMTRLPWAVPITPQLKANPHARLALEIAKFHEYAKPSQHEALARQNVIEQVRNLAYKILPDHFLELFGSERTGLATALSDIDLRLTKRKPDKDEPSNLPPTPEERWENQKSLHKLLRKGFRNNPDFHMTVFRHARYPLISVRHRASGLDVQIVLANDTSVSRDMIHRYVVKYPKLPEVYSVVKAIFDTRGLSDVFRGGFGSYPIFMMLVASLRHTSHPPSDAAGMLLNFLKFWSCFDTTKHGISIEPCMLFDKTETPVISDKAKAKLLSREGKPLPPYMLCLRDPADPTNDLGRKGICIKHVQKTFIAIHVGLLARLKPKNNETPPISFLKPVVGGMYTVNLPARKRLQDEGNRLFSEMQKGFEETARRIEMEETMIEEETDMALGLSQ